MMNNATNTFAPPAPIMQAPLPRYGCFGCGDPNHFIRDCPYRHANPPPAPQIAQQPAGRGRAYVLNAQPIQAIPANQTNNEGVNENA